MDRVIAINIRGVLVATQAALKHMKSGARIIMIGSAVVSGVAAPGLVPTRPRKGRQDVLSGAGPGDREPGITVKTSSRVRLTRN